MLNFDFYIAPETFGMNFGDAYMQWEVGFRMQILCSNEARREGNAVPSSGQVTRSTFSQESSCSYSVLHSDPWAR